MQQSSAGNATHRLLPRAWKEAEELRADPRAVRCGAGAVRVGCRSQGQGVERSDEPRAQPCRILHDGPSEGIAAGLGKDQVGPEHVVLAILWDPDTLTGAILHRLNVERDDIVERLAASGIPVPARPLPRGEEQRWGEQMDVPIGHLSALTAELPGLLPPSTPFGFNYDGRERGWVIAGESVDLPMYVAFALDAWERGRLPCDCCRFVTLNREAPAGRRRCHVCYWVHDPVQSGDPTYRGGANEINLAEARMNFSQFGACEARFRSRVRSPRPEEFPPLRATVR